MSDEPPFSPDAEPAKDSKIATVPAEQPHLVIPKRMKRKKFIRTITLREQTTTGAFRETQIPATLRDARLQQVVLVSKLQQTQERALDSILDDPTRVLTHSEMSGLNTAIKQSNEMMTKIFGGEPAAGSEEAGNGAATLGAALGAGISAGLSVIASGDPDLATALIAVTKSAKNAKKPEPINVTPVK